MQIQIHLGSHGVPYFIGGKRFLTGDPRLPKAIADSLCLPLYHSLAESND